MKRIFPQRSASTGSSSSWYSRSLEWLSWACSTALMAIALTPVALAQAPADRPDSTAVPDSTAAADLSISPRIGVEYNSSGAGYDGVTSFEGFIPLGQNPGLNLTFLEPRFLLDNEGNIGGSVLLGYRTYAPERDRIYGGYIAVDNRQTDHSNFWLLGLGLESLGEIWDFRINGYLPLGNTRQLVEEASFDSGTQLSSGFQGNLLVLNSRREQRTLTVREAALFGLDAEAGARLAHWQDGDLRAYAGAYYYDAEGTEGTLGWRLRLEARPVQNLTLGLAVQGDELFGTNLVASVGLTWPRLRPRGPITPETQVAARLGEPVRRNPTIAIDSQRDEEVTIENFSEPLQNPEEEQPYRFHHVTLGGRTGGDGTFERPFNTVQAALNATRSDGNDIVYVDRGTNPTIPAFRIPDRVQVLSQGPVQRLAGLPFANFPRRTARLPFSPTFNYTEGIYVQLPLSGDGQIPRIEDARPGDLVTLGNRTVLSGFSLADASRHGIAGTNVVNAEIRDTTITNAAERGMFLNNVTGSVVMFNNRVSNSRGGTGSGQGVLIQNSVDAAVQVTIADHQLTNNRVGIHLATQGDRLQGIDPQQLVTLRGTTIRQNQEQGLRIEGNDSGNQQVVFQEGTITANGGGGVVVRGSNSSSQELRLEDSTISRNTGAGIRVEAGTLNNASSAAQEIFIRRNTIASNTGPGIDIDGNEAVAQEFTIDRNLIQNNGGPGIQARASNAAFQEYVTDSRNTSQGISNNTITGNGGSGITLQATNSATVVADIQGNTLTDNRTNGAPDLEVATNSNSTRLCTVLINNTAPNIRLNNNSTGFVQGLFEVGSLSTVTVSNIGTVTLTPDLSTFTDKPGATSCF